MLTSVSKYYFFVLLVFDSLCFAEKENTEISLRISNHMLDMELKTEKNEI